MTTTVRRRVPPQWAINLINPVVRGIAHSPLHRLVDPALLVLHVTGRRSGRRMDIPVSYLPVDDRLVVVTQHRWRTNLRGGADVEVTHRGHRRPMRADVVEDPTLAAAVLQLAIAELGWSAVRRLLAVTADDGRVPQPEELADLVRESDLAVVTLRPA